MLIYLDMCCLKRPFDDQTQSRIRLESEVVLSLISIDDGSVEFVRSSVLMLENSLNPVPERALRVDRWLKESPIWKPSDADQFISRVRELMHAGMKNFDASHVASAELAGADIFVSVDDRLLSVAKRNKELLRVRVMGLLETAQEILK